ncbi:hypothetical protein SRHO_G00221260 [Serrasalmus rhombeus]
MLLQPVLDNLSPDGIVHYPPGISCHCEGVLEPLTALTGQKAGNTLDRLPVHHRECPERPLCLLSKQIIPQNYIKLLLQPAQQLV